MPAKKYYVVWVGQKPGIYTTWAEAERQVKVYPKAKYKSFPSLPEAEQAYANKPKAAVNKSATHTSNSSSSKKTAAASASTKVAHVKGHAGVQGNELADRMSVVAVEQQATDLCRYEGSASISELLPMARGG